ncbi:hypothetical protein Ndes2526B_g07167 [Nannochloris sp. 'desiccata']
MAAPLPTAVASVLKSIMPPAGEDVDEGLGDAASKEVFATYIARSLPDSIKALPHPGDIAEPASLAAVPLPKTDFPLAFPEELVSSGKLSAMQLEGTIHAATKHLSWLPSGERAGFFIGDGAGTGKGRQIASIILDSYLRGRVKSVWVSTSTDLYADATRDLRDLNCQIPVHNNLQSLDKAKVTPTEGCLFLTYSTLISNFRGCPRLSQLIDWVGGSSFDGVLVFDEAHKSKHYSANENQGTKVASAVVNIQKALPAARVVYASATGVSEVGNMAYMSRLGLFGAGSAFPTFEDFLASLKKKGISFLELLAMELKGNGFYLARGLSFRSAEFLELEIPLTQDQIHIYDAAVQMWVDLRAALTQAVAACSDRKKDGKDPFRIFWAAQQRFFKLLCVSMKVPAIVEEAKLALEQGNAVVIGLQSTGEAAADALDIHPGDCCGWVSVTKQILLQFVNTHFPTTKSVAASCTPLSIEDANTGNYENIVRGDYKKSTRATATADVDVDASSVNAATLVESDEMFLGLKEQMLQRIRALDLPPNFLDELIDKLGGKHAVAEMTGRKARIVRAANNNRPVYEARASPDSSEMDSLNIKEKDAFMSGRKLIAIVSDAASTGISLHADQRIKNQKRRVHLTIELPWSADKAIQQLGRSHRSNQVTAPVYKLVFTDLGGERRFAAAVARRLQSLGALTRGDRRAASGLDLGSLNYDSPLGRKALRKMYDAVVEQSPLLPPGISLEKVLEGLPKEDVAALAPAADGPEGRPTARNLVEAVENLHTIMRGYVDMMGIGVSAPRNDTVAEDNNIVVVNNRGGGGGGAGEAAANAAALANSGTGGSSKDTGDVRRFLNRLLAVPVHRQRLLFNYFTLMLNAEIKAAKQAGSYTEGVSDLPGQKISRQGPPQELWKDTLTGLSTYRHTVNVDRGSSFATAKSRLEHDSRHGDRSGFYRSRKIMPGTGKHAVLLAMQKPGAVGLYVLTRPSTGESYFEMDDEELLSKYYTISPENAQVEWDGLYESSLSQCSHGALCQIPNCHVGKRLQTVTILSGSVIRIWDTLERVLMRHEFELNKADRTMRIVRVEGAGETPGLPLIGLRYPGHLLEEVVAVLVSESQLKLAAAMAAAAGPTAGAGSNGCNGSAVVGAQNVAAMVLNQRRVDEVAPVVPRFYKKAFAKPKSMLDFFKPVAGGSGSSGTCASNKTKVATNQSQSNGGKRPNEGSIVNVSAKATGRVGKKVKKEPFPWTTADPDVIMLEDDEGEDDTLVPAALPAVEKEEEPPTAVPDAVGGSSDGTGNGTGLKALLPRPGIVGSLSELDIESIIAMGFTKSQAEALNLNPCKAFKSFNPAEFRKRTGTMKNPFKGKSQKEIWVGDYDYKFLCMPTLPYTKNSGIPPPFYSKDQWLGILVAAIMGLQHFMAMVGGIITPPILIYNQTFAAYGARDPKIATYLVNAALIVSGITTLIQVTSIPLGSYKGRKFQLGTGLVSVMGTSFTWLPIAVESILIQSPGQDGNADNWRKAYGAVLGTFALLSLIEMIIAFIPPKALRRAVPPLVSGVAVSLIGLGLIGSGFKNWGGGAFCCDNFRGILPPRALSTPEKPVLCFQCHICGSARLLVGE